MSAYKFNWTCGDCKTSNSEPIDKFRAAFGPDKQFERSLKCRNCGGGRVVASSYANPDINDPEILAFWLANPKCSFCMQDEDLMLMDLRFPTLVELITNAATPPTRRGLLLSALIQKFSILKAIEGKEQSEAAAFLHGTRADWQKIKAIPFQARKRAGLLLDYE